MFVVIVAALRLQIGADPFQNPIRITGDWTFDQYEHVLERPFTVPKGVARIDVTLEHTGKERRTVIDLGLRSPTGVRGWSGGRESAVHVSTLTATPGYLPGPIEPGRWTVILGVPNISRNSWFSVIVSDEHGPTLLTSAIYTE
jgi:hypothetical protein